MANSLVMNIIITEDLVTDAEIAADPNKPASYKTTVVGNARDHDAVCAATALRLAINELDDLLNVFLTSMTDDERARYTQNTETAIMVDDTMIVKQMAASLLTAHDLGSLLASLAHS